MSPHAAHDDAIGSSRLLALCALMVAVPGPRAGRSRSTRFRRQRTITTEEVVEADMESARLSLGPMRVIPMIVVDNAGYDSNVFSRPDGSAQGRRLDGDRGRRRSRHPAPMGSKIYLRFVAVPSYIWYDKLVDRRTWARRLFGVLPRARQPALVRGDGFARPGDGGPELGDAGHGHRNREGRRGQARGRV